MFPLIQYCKQGGLGPKQEEAPGSQWDCQVRRSTPQARKLPASPRSIRQRPVAGNDALQPPLVSSNPAIVSVSKHVGREYFAQHPGTVLHYQAPPGSLDGRDRASSDFKTPTWSWASVDGQISHRLPSGLVKADTTGCTAARTCGLLKGLLPTRKAKPKQAQVGKSGWSRIDQLID